MKNILAVVLGYALWTGLWLGGNQLFFAEAAEVVGAGERYEETGPLVAVIGLSIVCSLAGGALTGLITKRKGPVLVLAFLLLATGIAVQASAWELMPEWYHVLFLVLLLPVTRLGGSLGGASKVNVAG